MSSAGKPTPDGTATSRQRRLFFNAALLAMTLLAVWWSSRRSDPPVTVMRWRQTFTPKFVGHTSQPIENIWNTSVDYRRVYSEVYAPHQYEVCHVDGQTCWPQLTKDVDCAALMRDYRALLETYVPVVPGPREIPAAQRDEFLLNNWTLLSPMYMAQMSHSAHAPVPVWTSDTIKDFVQKAEARVAVGGYGWAALPIYTALDCHPVTGLQGAVFGTENPWVEALLFTFGATYITTIEFRSTTSHIPNHQVLKPLQWVKGVQSGELDSVDFAFSFSSWEHDGLGRYGDPIDPWGDIKAVQRASCYVKPGGLLFFAGPSSNVDQIMYNAHRIYGPVRIPMLSANWRILGVYGVGDPGTTCGTATCQGLFQRWANMAAEKSYNFQPIVVMQNLRTMPCAVSQA